MEAVDLARVDARRARGLGRGAGCSSEGSASREAASGSAASLRPGSHPPP